MAIPRFFVGPPPFWAGPPAYYYDGFYPPPGYYGSGYYYRSPYGVWGRATGNRDGLPLVGKEPGF